jgi:predicted nucleic acid-binding protein
MDVEVVQALRKLERAGDLEPGRGEKALRDLMDLRIVRWGHALLLDRVWELRHNLTAYDAVYVALAELLDAPLVTCDGRLARSAGHRARIRLAA